MIHAPLTQLFHELCVIQDNIKQEIRRRNMNLYNRWKSGGFQIIGSVTSVPMSSLDEIIEFLGDEDNNAKPN